MKSLAEHLGTIDPRRPEVAPVEAPKLTVRDFCRGILSSQEYRDSLLRRIYIDELPPAVECLLYHYAHGKPVEKVEIKDTTDDIDEMNAEQCEREAVRLLNLARELREEKSTDGVSIH